MSTCGKRINKKLLGYLCCLKYKATHHFLHSCPEQVVDKLTQELLMDGNTTSQPLPVNRVYSASNHTKLEEKGYQNIGNIQLKYPLNSARINNQKFLKINVKVMPFL